MNQRTVWPYKFYFSPIVQFTVHFPLLLFSFIKDFLSSFAVLHLLFLCFITYDMPLSSFGLQIKLRNRSSPFRANFHSDQIPESRFNHNFNFLRKPTERENHMDFSTALFFLSVIAAYLLWFVFITRSLKGPRVWPLLGSLPALIANSGDMHEWIAGNLRSCSGTYQTLICAVPFFNHRHLVTVTCDPKNIEHILKTRFDNYPKGPAWAAVFHELLGHGIFNADGDLWRFQRKTAALEFTTRTLRHAMARWVNRAIDSRLCPILAEWSRRSDPVDLQDIMLRITFDNICGLTFGKDPNTLTLNLPENGFAEAFDSATEASLKRFVLPGIVWKLRKRLRLGQETRLTKSLIYIEKYLTNVIETRKTELGTGQSGHDDLLSRFMKRKESLYSESFLRHVAVNFILAGRDTSSVALCWFFFLVMQNPSVEAKIVREICTVLMKTRGEDIPTWLSTPLDFEEVDRLVYLKAALSETLRLYPSVPEDSKHVVNDDILPDGTFVPAGSSVTYSIYSAGRMASTWGEDCLIFSPERWLNSSGDGFMVHDPFKFVAFNAGPRMCLGKDLAYLQMKSIAAAVLLRHRLTVAVGHKVEQKISLTLFMKYGLKVDVHRRDLKEVVADIKCGGGCGGG